MPIYTPKLMLAAGFVLAVTTASAQNAPAPSNQQQPFCPAAGSSEVADSAMPNLSAGMQALQNRSYALAYSHLHPLAENANVQAQSALGRMLMQSCGPNHDRSIAIDYLQKAADGGDTLAQSMLGRMYMNGDAVKQDDATAVKWLTAAAQSDDLGSEVNLGLLYNTGRGVPMDRYQAIVWWVRAGEKGAPIALGNIARSYATGLALPKDNEKALFWFITAFQRSTGAQRNLMAPAINNVAMQFSTDEVRRVTAESQKWSPGKGSLDKVLEDAAKRREMGPPQISGPALP